MGKRRTSRCSCGRRLFPARKHRTSHPCFEAVALKSWMTADGSEPASESSLRHLGFPRPCCYVSLRRTAGQNVKIAATEDGSALVLSGQSDPTFIQALARSTKTSVKLKNKNGRQRVIKP